MEELRKNVVVNYTYFLKNKENFTELQKYLFQYSYIRCKNFEYTVYIHCNNIFQEVCEELGITPDKFIPLEEDKDIDSNVFWAYHKIKVYDKQPIGEWHLDVDAVFKSDPMAPIFKKNIDIYTAYLDEPEHEFGNIYLPPNYTLPEYVIPSYIGLNMSAVYFNSQELKDNYCEEAFKFMKNNTVLKDNGWTHMVFVEQSLLKQMCDYYNYSYNFIIDNTDYYHLGAAKQLLTQEEKQNLINKIKNRIWQHITLMTSES